MKNPPNNVPQTGMEINIIFLLETVLKKWWLLVLMSLVVGASGFAFATVTKDPTYTSNLSFTAYNKEASEVISSSDISSSIMMTGTFKYVLEGRTMCQKVAENCSFPVTATEVDECMTVSTVADANILIVSVTTESAQESFEIASSIATHYGDIVDYTYPNASLRIYEHPLLAAEPDPQLAGIRYGIIGAIVGFAIAFAVILISNALKDTVQVSEDIQNKLDLTVIGTVGLVPNKKKEKGRSLLVTDKSLGFSFIETYKSIRTKIESLNQRNGYKTILITSAGENEGKTTVATNLALSLAQNGKSVLLIDADLRKPAVSKFLSLNVPKEISVSSVVKGDIPMSEAIKYVEKYKFFVLTSSNTDDEPTEILSSPQMETLIKSAENEFDFVIIDTSPAAVVTDAAILSNFADATVLVVRENFTACTTIRSVIDDLSDGKAEILGCVYNQVSSNGVKGVYGRYKYGYGYGYSRYGYSQYGYGYGSDEHEK